MPKYNNPRKTWQYTEEFKAKAVQLSELQGVQVKEVAETLDIHPFMLSRWRKEYREGKIVADKRKKVTSIKKEQAELDELKKLRKEVTRLKQENDLLKKWQRFLAEEHQNDIDSSRETDSSEYSIFVSGFRYPVVATMTGSSDQSRSDRRKMPCCYLRLRRYINAVMVLTVVQEFTRL